MFRGFNDSLEHSIGRAVWNREILIVYMANN